VEQISGMDYRDYCRERILDPLGMASSTFYLTELDFTFIATPYTNNNEPMWYYTSRHYPAGFLSTNIDDFAKFVQACLNYGALNGIRILQKNTFASMIHNPNIKIGSSNLWDHYIGSTIGHIGGGTGFSTSVEWDMAMGKAFFIFTNKVNNSVYHYGRLYELVKYQSQICD